VIVLQFSYARSIGAEAIRLFSRGWPSHVDIVLPTGSLLGARSDAIGAVPPGVQIRPPGYEIWTQTEIVRLEPVADEESNFLAFAAAQIGKPYDELAIAAFPVGRDWRETDSWFCSELVAAALETCRWFPRPLANGANEITPRDLLLAVSPWMTL
jgi:hypothetical protein